MSSKINRKKRSNTPLKKWVLVLASSVAQAANENTETLYYNGAKDLSRIHLTNNIDFTPWYDSEHHANTCLTNEMKHAGFIARQCLV